MYKYITIARSIIDTWGTPMYIYMNEDDKKYYISRMYPVSSTFEGSTIHDKLKYYAVDYPQVISDDDIKKGVTKYWNQSWAFTL
jgi:hypothetical protein